MQTGRDAGTDVSNRDNPGQTGTYGKLTYNPCPVVTFLACEMQGHFGPLLLSNLSQVTAILHLHTAADQARPDQTIPLHTKGRIHTAADHTIPFHRSVERRESRKPNPECKKTKIDPKEVAMLFYMW